MAGSGVQLTVTYFDDRTMYYQVAGIGWRIDHPSRCLVIGKFPRTYIPLDSVRSFEINSYGEDSPMESLAKVAYEAYAQCTGGKTFDGRDMPAWEDLGSKIQEAWDWAAQAVARAVNGDA